MNIGEFCVVIIHHAAVVAIIFVIIHVLLGVVPLWQTGHILAAVRLNILIVVHGISTAHRGILFSGAGDLMLQMIAMVSKSRLSSKYGSEGQCGQDKWYFHHMCDMLIEYIILILRLAI
ncbi:hypothetical protein [Plesiomonas shigelloides]|uniref:hypothetical protein n=1 Tax=Plesiomonas shigelloides TaxID=703 RepID=UPI0012629420|nr:hypothetical protein [Plesiomonas shigelloides]KAB7653635.1 hypothetical protein GBN14_14260 [Plesiomonas shigelloides]